MKIAEEPVATPAIQTAGRFDKKRVVPFIIVGGICGSLLYLFHYLAPLEIASVTFYAGVVIGFGGFVCLIKPIWLLGIRRRKVAALVILAGIALAIAGLFWPAGTARISARQSRLDDFMPEYHFSEIHETRVHADPARVTAAMRDVTFNELRVYHTLMKVRGLAFGRNVKTDAIGKRRVMDAMGTRGPGFEEVGLNRQEIVMAQTGRPWGGGLKRSESLEAFQAFNVPDSVKIASNLRVEDEGGGWSRVVTETRILATDDSARRTMGVYWRAIYPGSGMLRRTWLEAIRARSEKG